MADVDPGNKIRTEKGLVVRDKKDGGAQYRLYWGSFKGATGTHTTYFFNQNNSILEPGNSVFTKLKKYYVDDPSNCDIYFYFLTAFDYSRIIDYLFYTKNINIQKAREYYNDPNYKTNPGGFGLLQRAVSIAKDFANNLSNKAQIYIIGSEGHNLKPMRTELDHQSTFIRNSGYNKEQIYEGQHWEPFVRLINGLIGSSSPVTEEPIKFIKFRNGLTYPQFEQEVREFIHQQQAARLIVKGAGINHNLDEYLVKKPADAPRATTKPSTSTSSSTSSPSSSTPTSPPTAPTETDDVRQKREQKIITANKTRINEQAALIINADRFLAQKYNIVDKANDQRTSKLARKDEVYENFVLYRNGSADGAGGHIDFTKNLIKTEEFRSLLRDADPALLSALTPAIRIYKVFYPSKTKTGTKRGNQSFSWLVPFDEVPFNVKRGEVAKTSAYLGTNKQDSINKILNGESKLHGAGIKSFSYKFIGTNPAEVNSRIDADLELYFQDVRDLIKVIDVGAQDKNFIGDPKPTATLKFSYADLIADSPLYKSTDSNPIINEDYYRIKIAVGYSIPPKSYLKKLLNEDDDSKIQKLIDALKKATVVLYLNPHTHQVSFDETGSVILKIKYTCAMTTDKTNLNCLRIAKDSYTKLKTAEEAYDNALSSATTSDNKEKAKKALYKELADVEYNKNEVYAEIFSRLTGVHRSTNTTKYKLFEAVFNAEALGLTPTGELQTDTTKLYENLDKARQVKSFQTTKFGQEDRGYYLTQNPAIPDDAIIKPDMNDAQRNDAVAKLREYYSNLAPQTNLSKTDPSLAKGLFPVKFMFFGDIFDTFCEILDNVDYEEDRPKIVLTEFALDIPVSYKSGEGQNGIKYQNFVFNIADIPVSLEMFRYFFMERVVKQRLSKYDLFSLITDLLVDVISNSVSTSYFGSKGVLNNSVRMTSLSLSFPKAKDKDVLEGIRERNSGAPQKYNGIILGTNIKDKRQELIQSTTLETFSGNISNYSIMHTSNQFPQIIRSNNGVVDKDEAAGIFHMYVGSNRGLIKKIDFVKQDMPFYKEMKFRSSFGEKSLGRLLEVYDANITMFGNNIYRPGDFLYIEPIFFSTSQAAADLGRLGLGGYYMVMDVETKMSSDSYETVLRTKIVGRVENGSVESFAPYRGGAPIKL